MTPSPTPVGSGTGAVIRRQLLGRVRGFPLRARVEVAVIPSPIPAASHAACGFAALRAPAPLRVKSYEALRLAAVASQRSVGHPVVVEQPQVAVQPRSVPPFPAEAVTLARTRQVAPNLLLDPVSKYEKQRLEWPTAKYCTQPRSIGLMCAITSLMGRDRWLRNICLSCRSSAVRFLSRGVRSGIHRPRRLRIRRNSKPRNPKPSPCIRSTRRVFSSFTSTWSVANSSRSRRSTAARSQCWRECPSTRTTRSSANLAYSTFVPPLPTSDRLRSLQHRVHVVEIHVTEQRRNHPALRNAPLARRFQN